MNQHTKTLAVALVVTVGYCCVAAERARAQGPESSPLLRAMEEELQRSMNELSGNVDPPPYFMSYSVTETEQDEARLVIRGVAFEYVQAVAASRCRGTGRRLPAGQHPRGSRRDALRAAARLQRARGHSTGG